MSEAPPIEAAGAVVWRTSDHGVDHGVEVVLIHRPKYDDWSFPKGKLDPGELLPTAAVREVAEETGLRVRLGAPLGDQTYPVAAGHKRVHYWSARQVGDGDVSSYRPNTEVDEVAWLSLARARERLTHAHDAQLLAGFAESPFDAEPLLILRHARAQARETWTGDDGCRPLDGPGRRQARALVPLLRGYDVQQVLTSDAVRCVQTVAPYARQARIEMGRDHRWSESAATARAARAVRRLLSEGTRVVVCSHRPVLPEMFAAVGVADPQLEPGGVLVLHRRDGRVLAHEQHTG